MAHTRLDPIREVTHDAIQASKGVHPAIDLKAPHSAPFDADVTISSAEDVTSAAESSRSAPALEKPKSKKRTNALIEALMAYDDAEITERELVRAKTKMIKETQKHQAEIDRKKAKELEKESISVQSSSTWNIVKNVATYVASAGALVLGLSVSSAGTGAGAIAASFLIVSGVLNLAGRVLADTGGIDWIAGKFTETLEERKKLANQIETGFLLVSVALGLTGSIYSYVNGCNHLFTSAMKNVQNYAKTAYFSGHIIAAVGAYGKYRIDKKVLKGQEGLLHLEASQTAHQNFIRKETTEVESSIDMISEMNERASSLLDASGM
jgi:hypothetical protein